MCECCEFASEHRAGPAGESGTVKQVRGGQDPGRCAGADRGAVLVLQRSASVSVLVNLETVGGAHF